MLWKKESKNADALYVNLLDKVKPSMRNKIEKEQASQPIPKESEAISTQKRTIGNGIFSKMVMMIEAMDKYNESLCYAENGSENLSLAFANRSSTFMHKQKNRQALADIELAKNAGYPERLMPKLDKRKADALKSINQGLQTDRFDPKLAFEPNEHFPSLANVLKVVKDENGNSKIVASEDIDVGKMIIVEKSYIGYLGKKYLKCNVCLKGNANLVQCENCTTAMFCSTECQENPIHNFECGMKYSDNSTTNVYVMKTVRGIWMAIELFESADELMQFVEETIQSNRNELDDNLVDPKSKYKLFLKQNLRSSFADDEELLALTFRAFQFIMKMQKFDTMFKSPKHRRFLLHLIGFHVLIMNNHEMCYQNFNMAAMEMDVVYTQALMTKFIPHSCNPNVIGVSTDGHEVWFSLRPIKKGEQLFESSIGFHELLLSTKQRQEHLREQNKTCNCPRCIGADGAVAVRSYCQTIENDPDFINFMFLNINTSCPELRKMAGAVDKCNAFLRKYARNQWCDQVGTVMKILSEYYLQVMKNL